MSAKPIVVMYLPNHYEGSGWNANDIMHLLNGFDAGKSTATDYWSQYYWFVFYNHEVEVPELKVFYEKDFTPIKFEELKAFITDSIKQQKP